MIGYVFDGVIGRVVTEEDLLGLGTEPPTFSYNSARITVQGTESLVLSVDDASVPEEERSVAQTSFGFDVRGLDEQSGQFLNIVASDLGDNGFLLPKSFELDLNGLLEPDGQGGSAEFIEYRFVNENDQTTIFLVIYQFLSFGGQDSSTYRFFIPVDGDPPPEDWQEQMVESRPFLFGGFEVANAPTSLDMTALADEVVEIDDPSTPRILSLANDDDSVTGGTGSDFLDAVGGEDSIYGGPGNDSLVGRDGRDRIDGGLGNDEIAGGADADVLLGRAGNDNIGGGFGDDFIDAGDGDDTMGGGSGDDFIRTGEGDDVAAGGPGNDVILIAGTAIAGGSFGDDSIQAAGDDDSLGGGAGQDTLRGGGGDDSIGGGDGNDTITGGAGDDFLAGGSGNDLIRGGDGDDRINSGSGNDVLFGGDGADTFVFVAGDGGTDQILDFEGGADVILLRGFGGPEAVTIATDSDGTTVTAGDQVVVMTAEDGSAPALTLDDLLLV